MKKINLTQQLQGSIFMILFTVFAPFIDTLAKILSKELPPIEIALIRVTIQCLILLPIILARKKNLYLWPSQIHLHFFRGFFLASVAVIFFTALQLMPIADAVAIFFVEPLILTILSSIFLKEKVGWKRMIAIGFGFIGALLVIQPSFENVGWAAALPLAAAFCFACYLIITRVVSQNTDTYVMQFYAGFFALIILGIINLLAGYTNTIFTPVFPSLNAVWLLLCLGFVATSAHILLVLAFKKAQASVLAPLQYLEIIGATILGLLVFKEFPSITTWCGILIIVGTGLFVMFREQKLQKIKEYN